MLRLVPMLTLLVLFSCGDASDDTSSTSSSTGDAVALAGLGELCQGAYSPEGVPKVGFCKRGLICGAIAADCDLGICLQECVAPIEDDGVPGDPGCPTVDGQPSYCLLTSGLKVTQRGCGWFCGGPNGAVCPSTLSQALVCDSDCAVPSTLCVSTAEGD